jgi:hypothetical protein
MATITSAVNVEFPTVEEADAFMSESSVTDNSLDQVVLIDVVQAVTLGKLTLSQVITAGRKIAFDNGGFKVGSTYDFFDTAQRQYAQNLADIAFGNIKKNKKPIEAGDTVTDKLISELNQNVSSYYKGRMSLTIKSDLKQEMLLIDGKEVPSGRSYFDIEAHGYFVSSGVETTWATQRGSGAVINRSLYVDDLDKGLFYFLGKGGSKQSVWLGAQSALDFALSHVNTRGALVSYHNTLQTTPEALLRKVVKATETGSDKDQRRAQQELFLTVFKGIKVDLVPAIKEAPAAKPTK